MRSWEFELESVNSIIGVLQFYGFFHRSEGTINLEKKVTVEIRVIIIDLE